MRQARANGGWIGRGRLARATFAVFALLLQTLAPVAIMPPRGQAVHFAHVHHADHAGQHAGHHADAEPAETPWCPVCYALLAGGQSLSASAPVLAVSVFAYAPPPPPSTVAAPAAPPVPRARARAPPLSV